MLTGDILRRSAARFPDRPAIVFRGPDRRSVVSYRELERDANRLARALVRLAPAPGTKIAMLSRNLPEYGTVFFGVARTGCVLNNVSILYAPDELAWVLKKSDTEVLIFDAALLDKVDAVRASCPSIRHFVCIGGKPPDWAQGFDALLQSQAHADDVGAPQLPIDECDAFCMTYTGGTTGRPKGVLASHRARAITAHTVMVEEAIDERDRVAIVTPLFHVAALNIMFQPAVLAGATSVFVTPWSAERFVEAVEEEGVTATFMVPTQANALVNSAACDPARLATWTKISFAGAPMPDWVQLELMKRLPQLKLTQIYGQSEIGVVAVLRHWYLPEKLGAVGHAPYNVDTEILRADGTPADVGEIGEVASRGDNLMIGYYGEPEQTEAFFRVGNGWGLTGDVGVKDADGFITLIDRAKDMLISGGENVYPKEIEDAIYTLEAVGECAVFGIPDERWGEVPAAYIQLRPGHTLTEDEVIARCEQKLARLKRPRLIRFVNDFPKTPIGKIQKNLLKEPYWQGRKKI